MIIIRVEIYWCRIGIRAGARGSAVAIGLVINRPQLVNILLIQKDLIALAIADLTMLLANLLALRLFLLLVMTARVAGMIVVVIVVVVIVIGGGGSAAVGGSIHKVQRGLKQDISGS